MPDIKPAPTSLSSPINQNPWPNIDLGINNTPLYVGETSKNQI